MLPHLFEISDTKVISFVARERLIRNLGTFLIVEVSSLSQTQSILKWPFVLGKQHGRFSDDGPQQHGSHEHYEYFRTTALDRKTHLCRLL
jgi:hypothetical protein